VEIINRLDDEVDVVASGHSHRFTNALVKSKNHKKILVTQAFWHGEAYADIDLIIDPATKDVVDKRAHIKATKRDEGPGQKPDLQVAQLVEQADALAEARFKSMIKRGIKDPIGIACKEIWKKPNSEGESALGNLVADAYRQAGGTHFAFVQLGGIRANIIGKGKVTWRDLFCVQPFMNKLVKLKLTGQQIYELLNQQWYGRSSPMFLQVSGLRYTWDEGFTPPRIVGIWDNEGNPVKKASTYTVTVNSFLAKGGDNFTLFREIEAKNMICLNVSDFVALVDYIEKKSQPFSSKSKDRITKIRRRQ
jgi:5'-nucleotidase